MGADASRPVGAEPVLEVFTIFARPADVPAAAFVVRLFTVGAGGQVVATDRWWTATTLAMARAWVPFGLVCMPADPGDDPAVVESWL